LGLFCSVRLHEGIDDYVMQVLEAIMACVNALASLSVVTENTTTDAKDVLAMPRLRSFDLIAISLLWYLERAVLPVAEFLGRRWPLQYLGPAKSLYY